MRQSVPGLLDLESPRSSIGGATHDSDVLTRCVSGDVAVFSSCSATRTLGPCRLSILLHSGTPAALHARDVVVALVLLGAGAGGVPDGLGGGLVVGEAEMGLGV